MKKVLAVDDAEVTLMRFRRILEGIGCEVLTAASGLDGVNAAKNNGDIDLIIVDFHMPGINGIETCHKIRELAEHKNTVMMMCTTESSVKMKAAGKEAGIKCWLMKPINEELFINAVKMLLGKM